jgi:hypothetical protein
MKRQIQEILKELADEVRINNKSLISPEQPFYDPTPAGMKETLVDIDIHLKSVEPKISNSSYLLSKLVSQCENTKELIVFENGEFVIKQDWMKNDLEATMYGAIWYMCMG